MIEIGKGLAELRLNVDDHVFMDRRVLYGAWAPAGMGKGALVPPWQC